MTIATPPRVNGRLEGIQVLRGLAALLVVLSHLASATGFRFPPVVDAFRGTAGQLGVGLFFLISGVVVPWSLAGRHYRIASFPRYIARRLIRLDPPYFATIALALAMLAIHSVRDGTPFPYSWQTVAIHLGYLSGVTGHPWVVPVFWTLGIEFQFYIIVGLVFPLLEPVLGWRYGTAWWLVILSAMTLGLAWLPIGRVEAFWPLFGHYFLLGFSVFLVRRGHAHWGIVPWMGVLVWWWFPPLGGAMWGVLIAGAAVMLLAPSQLPGRRLWQPFLALGAVSYSLYLTHALILGKITAVTLARGWLNGTASAFGVAAAEVAVSLLVATVLYWVVERSSLRLSRYVRF